jgi:hypothetical protein
MHSEYRITDQGATASWQSHLPLHVLFAELANVMDEIGVSHSRW